jgi:transposase
MTEFTREEVLTLLGGDPKDDGHRQFLAEARGAAVTYAEQRISDGESAVDVAAELKMNRWTLQKWLQRHRKGGLGRTAKREKGFRRLKVASRPAPKAAVLVVHGPCGVRVEGLDVAGVASLLEKLSCLG